MAIIPGHILALKLPFANGTPCFSKRPFLVIDKHNDTLDLLNVSSSRGKEKKLLYASNESINCYDPPLDQPSFLKLDELYTIDYFDDLHKSIYKGRPPIISEEYARLTNEFFKYKFTYGVSTVKYIETMVRQENYL
jgi:hypothetical protein